jgi:hypothetical protein
MTYRFLPIALLVLAGSIAVPASAGAAVLLNQWGNGTLGFIVDGTSNTIQLTETSRVAVCLDNVGLSVPFADITDGTSNTLAFSEIAPWSLQVGFVRTRQPISSITDGTSNTIILGEAPQDALCFGDGSVIPPITDGTSNTIMFGEESSFDICVSDVRIGSIVDGTSNTILFGEVASDPVCYAGARVAPAIAAAIAEPPALALAGVGLLGFGLAMRRRPG